MDWSTRIARAFDGGTRPDDDVLEELAQHASAVYEAARAEGCTAEEATRRVDTHVATWARDAAVLARRTRPSPNPPPVPGSRRVSHLQS